MKNRSKKFVLAALAGLLIFAPVQSMHVTVGNAAQVSSSNDSKLSELDISPGTLSPAFSPDILEYTATVDADVTTVSVRAIPRASGGTIAAVEGAKSIGPGANTVKVTCSAPDNSYTVYSITINAGGSAEGPQSAVDPDGTGEGDTTGQPADIPGGEGDSTAQDADTLTDDAQNAGLDALSPIVGPIAQDGTVTLNGAAYKLSSNFSYSSVTQDIPSAFGQGSVQIGETSYPTFHCEANDMHLVYMENTDGNGSTGFYYYDDKQNAVERFKYTGIGENFVVFISSARAELPAGYAEKTLTLPSGKDVVAYQSTTAKKKLKDYYLIYGLNSDGSNGWYLYDKAQGTYMRYAKSFGAAAQEPAEEEPIERTVTLNKYNLQVEKYNKLKSNMVKAVSGFVIAFLLMIIIFTALLFRSRDAGEESHSVRREPKRSPKNPKKTQKPKEEMGKNSLAAGKILDRESTGLQAKKVTKKILPEPKKERITASINTQEHVSTPEEIRKQMQQEQLAYEQQSNMKKHAVKKQEQELQARMKQEQELQERLARERELQARMKQEQELQARLMQEQQLQARTAREPDAGRMGMQQQRSLLKQEQPVGAADSVQLAAEKMRQSVQFTHKSVKSGLQEDQPVTDASSKTAGHDPMDDWEVEDTAVRRRSRKKKRSRMDEDVEIMDLNDL